MKYIIPIIILVLIFFGLNCVQVEHFQHMREEDCYLLQCYDKEQLKQLTKDKLSSLYKKVLLQMNRAHNNFRKCHRQYLVNISDELKFREEMTSRNNMEMIVE